MYSMCVFAAKIEKTFKAGNKDLKASDELETLGAAGQRMCWQCHVTCCTGAVGKADKGYERSWGHWCFPPTIGIRPNMKFNVTNLKFRHVFSYMSFSWTGFSLIGWIVVFAAHAGSKLISPPTPVFPPSAPRF